MEQNDYPERMLLAFYEAWHNPDYRNYRYRGMTGAFIAIKADIISLGKITGEEYYSSPIRAEIVEALKMMADEGLIEKVDDPKPGEYPQYIIETGRLWGGYDSAKGFVKVPSLNVDNWWFRLTSKGKRVAKELVSQEEERKLRKKKPHLGFPLPHEKED